MEFVWVENHTLKIFFHFSFIMLKCTFMNCDVVSLSVSRAECSQEEFGQFPYRLLDWFLLLSRMGERYTPAAPSQSCLTHTERTQLAQVTHTKMPPLYHTSWMLFAYHTHYSNNAAVVVNIVCTVCVMLQKCFSQKYLGRSVLTVPIYAGLQRKQRLKNDTFNDRKNSYK